MTTAPLTCPIGRDELIDYLVGELAEDLAERLEEHLFDCPRCASSFEALDAMRSAVSDAVLRAEIGGNVNAAFLERARRDGLTWREYRIPEGDTVACSAGPEDLVVVRLAADYGEVEGLHLEVDFQDLERRVAVPIPDREVAIDQQLDEIVLVFPGEVVRGYPRSRWTLRLLGWSPDGPLEIGPFVMDHTP